MVALLFAAACGGGDSTSDSSATTPPTTTPLATQPAPATTAEPTATTTTTTSTTTTTTSTTTIPEPSADIRIFVADGEMSQDINGQLQPAERRYQANAGDDLVIEIFSDQPDQEVHLHGYDLTAYTGPDTPARFDFEADIPGIFEVEFEATHQLIFELAVS